MLDIIDPEDGTPPRRLIFHGDYLDSSNPRDRRQIINRAEDAREESERTSMRVRETKDYQREHGMGASGRPPYGMKVAEETRKLEPDPRPAIPDKPAGPSKADVARRWYLEAIEGHSTRAIARGLNAEGIPSSSGGRWSPQVVYQHLLNPVYAGWQVTRLNRGHGIPVRYMDRNGRPVRVGEGVVNDEEHHLARETVGGHRIAHMAVERSGHGRAKHLLTGLLRCEGCGSRMPCTGSSYSCVANKAGKPCEARASAIRGSLERYVVECWRDRLLRAEPNDPMLVVAAQRWLALTRPDETAEIAATRAAAKAAESAVQRLLADRQAGVYEGPAARFFNPMLEQATRDVEVSGKALRDLAGSSVDISFLLEETTAIEAWESADAALRRDLLALAIDEIYVSKCVRHTGRNGFDGRDRVKIRWAETGNQ
ncbi:recombinase family protein [Streptomyces sp. NPDC021093]|uniref:recombinase family protein n=1 Tax=Streptomyces sp. NPDC021093 TaxID=3365112 RepID=UPI0037A980FD